MAPSGRKQQISVYAMLPTSSACCHSVSRDLRLVIHMIYVAQIFRGTLLER